MCLSSPSACSGSTRSVQLRLPHLLVPYLELVPRLPLLRTECPLPSTPRVKPAANPALAPIRLPPEPAWLLLRLSYAFALILHLQPTFRVGPIFCRRPILPRRSLLWCSPGLEPLLGPASDFRSLARGVPCSGLATPVLLSP